MIITYLYVLLACVAIKVKFDQYIIEVKENVGSVKPPRLELSEASPCCMVIRAELVDDAAKGKLCNLRMYA